MKRVDPTKGAKFLNAELVRLAFLIFAGGVVATLTSIAGQRYQISHDLIYLSSLAIRPLETVVRD